MPEALTPSVERFSPTFLATFLGCRQATAWDLARRRGKDDATPDGLDGHGELITELGKAHERRILERLRASAEVAVIPDPRSPDDGVPFAATRAAMEAGVPWLHQAALADGRWFGYADFLRRVETPSERWPWSYEPWDAKLSRHAQPKQVLQIAIYGELIEAMQGSAPAAMGLMLGGDARDAHVEARFAFDDFRHYTRRVAERLLAFAETLPEDFAGEPCKACGQCCWASRCEGLWDALDHLSRVADISASQRARLVEAGIGTLTALAELAVLAPETRPPVRLERAVLERLIEQAALQRRTRLATADGAAAGGDGADSGGVAGAPLAWTLLPHRAGYGLDRLPPPDPADLYFDFEGDPLEPGGLEYLCGVVVRADVADALGGSEGVDAGADAAYRFVAFWAHDRDGERRAFDALVDALEGHFRAHPKAHLYHYAPYERSALRRLAMMHGTREDAVDALLRGRRLVDLYRVVREGLRVGAESYSIKRLEPLYMSARGTETCDGGDSVVMYHAWRATGEPALLADIERYNRDDCVSTALLHRWLLARSAELERIVEEPSVTADEDAGEAGADDDAAIEDASARERRERAEFRRAEVERLERALVDDGGEAATGAAEAPASDGAGEDATDEGATVVAAVAEREARRLAADLLRFHQREAKPDWWQYFERRESPPETLVDDPDCLGGCEKDPAHWGEPIARSLSYRFRFPPQETRLAAGATAKLQDGGSAGEILELDARAGTLLLKRGRTLGEPPERLALMPGGPIDTTVVADALRGVVDDFADGGDAHPHLAALLRREPPRIAAHPRGAPIVPAEITDPAAVLDATISAVRRLDRSWLCVQGPPGAGKTYTLARVIDALIGDGRRVGVSSNSHAAIDNVLAGVERFRAASGRRPLRGFKKVKAGERYASPLVEPMVVACTGRKRKDGTSDWDPEADLFGGTAWWFAAEDGPRVDVLVVDEAGQVSLGHLVGMARAARSVVLVGDPMQLPQPIKGAHPRASGASCLEHVIGESAVIPPERGIFLGTTWRMHPELARFVSDTIYDGRLRAEPACGRQRLVAPGGRCPHPALKSAGIGFVELDHAGCAQRSEEEAEEIARLYRDLLAMRVVDRAGEERAMTPDDVLVVAPYNLQVKLLGERLAPVAGAAARVGTVDRFQGQEAEAVLVSMTTSGAQSMPRDASFLLSRNRLNVALSRARCLAVVVASSGLLDLDVRSVEEMRLANLLCRARAAGAGPKAAAPF